MCRNFAPETLTFPQTPAPLLREATLRRHTVYPEGSVRCGDCSSNHHNSARHNNLLRSRAACLKSSGLQRGKTARHKVMTISCGAKKSSTTGALSKNTVLAHTSVTLWPEPKTVTKTQHNKNKSKNALEREKKNRK